jgi:hypothetical protein
MPATQNCEIERQNTEKSVTICIRVCWASVLPPSIRPPRVTKSNLVFEFTVLFLGELPIFQCLRLHKILDFLLRRREHYVRLIRNARLGLGCG